MLTTEQVKVALRDIALFQGCSDPTLTEIAALAVEKDYQKGDIIYETGADAVDLFILVDGIVTFVSKASLGFLNVQQLMERSMIFGWIALLPQHRRRIGRAQCLEDSKIFSINGSKLLAILDQDPQSGYSVMKGLSSLIAKTFVEKG